MTLLRKVVRCRLTPAGRKSLRLENSHPDIMAIYHLRHTFVGRTKHEPGTAAAHINYITRENVCTEIMVNWAPANRHNAKEWIVLEEINDAKNARVIDKLTVALPHELTHEQNKKLLEDFCQNVTKGRCPWFIAIHSKGKDIHNPHAHIVLRDRDIETGKRVMKTTDRGSTKKLFREAWQNHLNKHLEMNGHDGRVSCKTLIEQGIFDRAAQVNIGPEANEAAKKGHELKSQVRMDKHRPGWKKEQGDRPIKYPDIDRGMTRKQHNQNIINDNIQNGKNSLLEVLKLRAVFEEKRRMKLNEFIRRRDDIRKHFDKENTKLVAIFGRHYKQRKNHYRQEFDQQMKNLDERFRRRFHGCYERERRILRHVDLYEQNLSDWLKKDVKYIWRQLDTTQDKTRGKLTKLFKRQASRDDLKSIVKVAYKIERQKIARVKEDQRAAIVRLLDKKYQPYLAEITDPWLMRKDKLKEEMNKLWEDHKKDFHKFKSEERHFKNKLDREIEAYYKNLQERMPPPARDEKDKDNPYSKYLKLSKDEPDDVEKYLEDLEKREKEEKDKGKDKGPDFEM